MSTARRLDAQRLARKQPQPVWLKVMGQEGTAHDVEGVIAKWQMQRVARNRSRYRSAGKCDQTRSSNVTCNSIPSLRECSLRCQRHVPGSSADFQHRQPPAAARARDFAQQRDGRTRAAEPVIDVSQVGKRAPLSPRRCRDRHRAVRRLLCVCMS